MQLWFGATLRDGIAMTAAGGFATFRSIASNTVKALMFYCYDRPGHLASHTCCNRCMHVNGNVSRTAPQIVPFSRRPQERLTFQVIEGSRRHWLFASFCTDASLQRTLVQRCCSASQGQILWPQNSSSTSRPALTTGLIDLFL